LCAEEGIGEGHDDIAFEAFTGTKNGMAGTFCYVLVKNFAFGANAFGDLKQFCFNGIAKSTHYETDFIDGFTANGHDIGDEPMNDGFASNFDEGFGGGKCMRAHAFAHAGHWNDEFHSCLKGLFDGQNDGKGNELV
jgi:hypothetical protein